MLQHDVVILDAGSYGSVEHLRLLEHLLEHEVSITALLSSVGIPFYLGHLKFHGLAVDIRDLDGILCHRKDAVISEEDNILCILDHGSNVGSDEVLILTYAYYDRVILLRAYELIGLIYAENTESISTLDIEERSSYGAVDILVAV